MGRTSTASAVGTATDAVNNDIGNVTDVSVPDGGEGELVTGPDDVSSASLLRSSMIGIAAVTTVFVAIA
jgi:hypothetical protein